MNVNKAKLYIAMANAEIPATAIKSVSRATYHRMIAGKSVRPASVGRLAKELGVNAADIVDVERG